MTVDHRALDEAEADLRDAVAEAGAATDHCLDWSGRRVVQLRECAEACIALHRRELSRALDHLKRASKLLAEGRNVYRFTFAERATWQDDVDELLAELGEPPR